MREQPMPEAREVPRPLRNRISSSTDRGFTLIELLIVILVIGILLAVAAPSFLGQQAKAQDSASKQQLAVAYKAAKAYSVDGNGAPGHVQGAFDGFDSAALLAVAPELAAANIVIVQASGDGLELSAASASGAECSLIVTDGGAPVTTCVEGGEAASPGFDFYFVSGHEGNDEIYGANADGSNVTNLSNDSGHDWFARLSPDGSKIAFVSARDGDNEIYTMDADGSNVEKLTDNSVSDTAPIEWSPDSSKIAFVSTRDVGVERPHTMNADGSNQTLLADLRYENDSHFKWSPDSAQLTFGPHAMYPMPPPAPGYGDILVVSADGTGLTNVTNSGGFEGVVDWAPDGRILYLNSVDFGMWAMDADGSNQTNLTGSLQPFAANGYGLAFEPDGTRIAFSSAAGSGEIYVMDADGSNLAQLTSNSATDRIAAWTSDGKLIFVSDRDGGEDIYSMNPDGSDVTRLTTSGNYMHFAGWR